MSERAGSTVVEAAGNPESQSRIRAAMKRGLQARNAEMALDRILSEPAHH
jgi:hypothetical protein